MNTPNAGSQRFDELCEWFNSIRSDSESTYHLYAIVDGVLDQGVLSEVQRSHAAWRGLYPDTMLESNSPAMGPFLVELTPHRAEHTALMQTLLQRGRDIDLVLWTASRQSLSVLAAHFHCYAEVLLPDRGAALLRYYDPSILEVLVRMFTSTQREHFLSPVDQHRFWRAGWQTVAGLDKEEAPPVLPNYIVLTGEQYELLSNENFAETLYHQLRSEILPPMAKVDGRDCIQVIRQLLARAVDRYQLKNQNDLAYFALLGLNINTTFDEHPKVAEALRSKADVDAPMSEKLTGIDAAVWKQLLEAGIEANS